ncbi:MAG: heme exporter protein CcmB [Candidatus Hydrothermarchaeales archaeon]
MDFKGVLLVAKKDLKIEARSRDTLSFMFVFAFVILVMFNFSAEPFSESLMDVAPGLLWFVFIFTGMLGLSRAFIKEKDAGTLEGLRLTPLGANEILIGKMLYNLVLILIVEIIALPLFIGIFNYQIAGSVLDTIFVLTLGNIGFVVVGSFMSAIILSSRSRELVLQLLVLPILVPIIVPTILALRKIMIYGESLPTVLEIRLIVAYIIIMSTLSFLLFSYVLEE